MWLCENLPLHCRSYIFTSRGLYNFAESKHEQVPADIDVAKLHDLNPSSYEDVKVIIRKESKNVGISKYETGKIIICVGGSY